MAIKGGGLLGRAGGTEGTPTLPGCNGACYFDILSTVRRRRQNKGGAFSLLALFLPGFLQGTVTSGTGALLHLQTRRLALLRTEGY